MSPISGSSHRLLLTGFTARPIVVLPSVESQELQDKQTSSLREELMIRQLAGALALAVASIVVAVAPTHAQDQKGTLVFAVESLGAQTLDPILEGRPGNAVYQAIMYDALVGFDLKKGGVGPGVAERWEMTPDGLTWTFFIRDRKSVV